MGTELLRRFINEVLAGFGSPGLGKDGVAGNVYPSASGDVGVRPQAHGSVLDDETADEDRAAQEGRQAACCLIIADDGTVLAVSRKGDPTALGLPGGKVDPGETPEVAAARELTEETGLQAVRLRHVFSKRDAQGFTTHTFACEATGEIATDEAGVIRWVHPSLLVDEEHSPFVDYNRALFATLGWRV